METNNNNNINELRYKNNRNRPTDTHTWKLIGTQGDSGGGIN